MKKTLKKPAQAAYNTKRAWLNAMEHCLVELDRKDSIAAENLELGRKLLQSGRLCDDRDIRSGQLFQLLGELIVTVGDKSTALPYFLKCVACYEVSHPESIAMARAHAWISSCLLDSNAYGDAISSLKRAINILEPHQLNDANLWWWVIHSYVFYQSKRGKTREIVSAMRKCLPVAHHSCKDLKPALEICAQISMRRTSAGAEAANLLKELLESRYSHYKSHNQAQKPTLEGAADIDLLLNALEDVNSDTTKSWVHDRNELTEIILKTSPSRSHIHFRAWQLSFHASISDITYRASQFFYQLRTPDAARPSVMSSRTLWSFPKVVLKASDYSQHGCLTFYEPSDKARYLAYGTSADGSDNVTIRVRDLKTGKDLEDCLREITSSHVAWRKQEGFYYQHCKTSADGKQKTPIGIFFHKLGQTQREDVLVMESKPDTWASIWCTEGWLIITETGGHDDSVRFYLREDDEQIQDKPFCILPDCFGNGARAVTFQKDCLDVVSYLETENGKSVRYNVQTGSLSDVISETNGFLLVARASGPDHLFGLTLDDCNSKLSVHSRDGDYLHTVELPPLSRVRMLGYGGEEKLLIRTDSGIRPPAISLIDLNGAPSRLWFESDLPFDSELYEEELVFCESFDGVRIPVHISKRRDVKLANAAVILKVYGGFGRCMLPASFDSNNAVWMEMGGVVATAATRGGHEYGRQWHNAGKKENRINVVNDILAVAEYFSGQGVTSSRLGIIGDSNGGLMVAAAVARSPGAFGAACIGNPLIDILNFPSWNFGRLYISEYGDPENEAERKALLTYSPLHVMQNDCYPATLVQVANNDDRVHKSNGYKYVAKLESVQQASHRTLLRVYEAQGHAHSVAGNSWSIDRLAFLADALGLDASPLERLIKRDKRSSS